MNRLERRSVQKALRMIKRSLAPLEICPILYENKMLRTKSYDKLADMKSKISRRDLCSKFLKYIMKSNSKCTFDGLLAALKHEHKYDFIADKLEQIITKKRCKSASRPGKRRYHNKTDSCGAAADDQQIPTLHNNTPTAKRNLLYKSVDKTDVYTERRARVMTVAYQMKRLRHEGDMDALNDFTREISMEFEHSQYADRIGEVADRKFIALEAMASAGRVKYENDQCNMYVEEMKEVIPFTSQPHVSSMTYLARFGSSVAMQGKHRLDDALGLLHCARQHASNVHGGLESGMVCYIQVNLLSQKYEDNPTSDLQNEVLKTAELAIANFQEEPDDIRNDYERMLQLKMVFCRLGIGLFGKRIERVTPSVEALESAKSSLERIERPSNWKGMETRRIMLYHIAKSVLYQHQGIRELALLHGKEARRIAIINKWNAELPNIIDHVEELKSS